MHQPGPHANPEPITATEDGRCYLACPGWGSTADSPLQTPGKGFAQRRVEPEWEELPALRAACRRTRLTWASGALLSWGVLRAGAKMDDGPTSASRL